MKRGELYRVYHGSKHDPKKQRVFVIISRQIVIDSKFSTVTCAPIYTTYDGISTQVRVGIEEGLKHGSSIHCDELISIPKIVLTDFTGTLSGEKLIELKNALLIALEIEAV
ncbi:MAG: type II toxin-antitoxin system PemK/MazF family toxin [Treponema sp.]|jgi:mRNA interferase MazF|nr:type II toxin-antitoxin system PemK/MazF family toxin [Treponema sp.]